MWDYIKYILIFLTLILLSLTLDLNYFQFGILSELVWLCFFYISSVTATTINDNLLYNIPFLILCLTAVEAVVFWSLVLLNIKH